MGAFGKNEVGRKFLTRLNFYVTLKKWCIFEMIILVVFITFFFILKNGVFCEIVILVVFNSFNVVKNLKTPDLVARQKPLFYTTGWIS